MAKLSAQQVLNQLGDYYKASASVNNYYTRESYYEDVNYGLKEYAHMAANDFKHHEDADVYQSLKEYVDDGTIDAESFLNAELVLLDTTDIDVIGKIIKDDFIDVSIETHEWYTNYRMSTFLDGVWKMYNHGYCTENFAKDWLEKNDTIIGMRWLLKQGLPEFGNTTFDEVVSFVKSMDSFDEKAIRYWLKIK